MHVLHPYYGMSYTHDVCDSQIDTPPFPCRFGARDRIRIVALLFHYNTLLVFLYSFPNRKHQKSSQSRHYEIDNTHTDRLSHDVHTTKVELLTLTNN